MATLPGIKEKVHLPLYDAFVVPGPSQTFGQAVGPEQRLRFFVDIQQKTRLETNLQAAGVLPHTNSFEIRAIRLVVSSPAGLAVLQDRCRSILDAAVKLTQFRRRDDWNISAFCQILTSHLAAIQETAALALAELIYSAILSLIVGEKVMLEMPAFWFPAGAGVGPGNGLTANHGEPDPQATFRLAEPIFIEARQNFRVELTFPQGILAQLAATPGPLRVWVILDGYLTRAVQ
jgi:hypothetical protein